MAQKHAVYIIPGFRHSSSSRAYKNVAKILKAEGYLPISVDIPWGNKTISENAEYFLKEFKKNTSKKKSILGFSYGAMIAFLASTKVDVTGLVLCSLSPYFKEDLPRSSKPTRQNKDSSKLHFKTLAKQIRAKKTLMLYGDEEAKSLINRTREAFDQISSENKYLFSISKTEHNIGDRKYLNKIQEVTRVLN